MRPSKVVSRAQLAKTGLALLADEQALVLTNGCFDILHVGHVRYLQAARELGAALAVGLNSDTSVRRLKGPGRPITNESDRAEILAALACVDYVTVFDESTASELVAAVRPSIYVKGGDYSADPSAKNFPPEGHVAATFGGEVRIIPFTAGRSTSGVIAAIAESETGVSPST